MESGFLPAHIKTPAQSITIAWKGQELGIPPLVAFSSIAVINGKPALSAELMRSLVFRKYPTARIELVTPVDKQNEEAKYLVQRPGGGEQFFQFTLKEAAAAGLLTKDTWKKYPMALLQARATSMACRQVFPDALNGCVYTPEELGGEIIDIDPAEDSPSSKSDNQPSAGPSKSGNTKGYEERTNAKMNELATEPQQKRLWAMSKQANYDNDQLHDLIMNVTGKESSKELTKADMNEIFKVLEEDLQRAQQ